MSTSSDQEVYDETINQLASIRSMLSIQSAMETAVEEKLGDVQRIGEGFDRLSTAWNHILDGMYEMDLTVFDAGIEEVKKLTNPKAQETDAEEHKRTVEDLYDCI